MFSSSKATISMGLAWVAIIFIADARSIQKVVGSYCGEMDPDCNFSPPPSWYYPQKETCARDCNGAPMISQEMSASRQASSPEVQPKSFYFDGTKPFFGGSPIIPIDGNSRRSSLRFPERLDNYGTFAPGHATGQVWNYGYNRARGRGSRVEGSNRYAAIRQLDPIGSLQPGNYALIQDTIQAMKPMRIIPINKMDSILFDEQRGNQVLISVQDANEDEAGAYFNDDRRIGPAANGRGRLVKQALVPIVEFDDISESDEETNFGLFDQSLSA